jgi:hypothetical protein
MESFKERQKRLRKEWKLHMCTDDEEEDEEYTQTPRKVSSANTGHHV